MIPQTLISPKFRHETVAYFAVAVSAVAEAGLAIFAVISGRCRFSSPRRGAGASAVAEAMTQHSPK